MKYDKHGREYRLADVRPENVVVWTQVLWDEGEYREVGDYRSDGELRIMAASDLFDSPPRDAVDSEICELRALLADLAKQLESKKQEARDVDKSWLEMTPQGKKLSQNSKRN